MQECPFEVQWHPLVVVPCFRENEGREILQAIQSKDVAHVLARHAWMPDEAPDETANDHLNIASAVIQKIDDAQKTLKESAWKHELQQRRERIETAKAHHTAVKEQMEGQSDQVWDQKDQRYDKRASHRTKSTVLKR